MTHPDNIHWNADGLIPVVAQEFDGGDVLMLAWMNREALEATLQTGCAVYFSRSRQKLWRKGETSGHVQQVREILLDCDGDALLLRVVQTGHTPGIACHTGHHSCFYRRYQNGAWEECAPVLKSAAEIYGK